LTLQQSSAVLRVSVRAGKTSLNICSYQLSLAYSQAAVAGGRNTISTPAQSPVVSCHVQNLFASENEYNAKISIQKCTRCTLPAFDPYSFCPTIF
jgi:hypothetical protein